MSRFSLRPQIPAVLAVVGVLVGALLASALTAGSAQAAFGGQRSSGKAHAKVAKAAEVEKRRGSFSGDVDFGILDPPGSPEEEVFDPLADRLPWLKQINPRYESGQRFQLNCMNCVWAGYLYLSGSPATALPLSYHVEARRGAVERYMVEVKQRIAKQTRGWFQPMVNRQEIDYAMAEAGEGAYGIVSATTAGLEEYNHLYLVVRTKGQTHYIDPQRGTDVDPRDYQDFELLLAPTPAAPGTLPANMPQNLNKASPTR